VLSASVVAMAKGVVKVMLTSKLKPSGALFVTAVALIAAGTAKIGYRAQAGEQPEPAKQPQPIRDAMAPWGEPSGGLRMRIMPVPHKTTEQRPDLATVPTSARFASAHEVTFVVELQNVSDKPISLQGTRFGDSTAPPRWGRSCSDFFGPRLFTYELVDKNRKPVDRPVRKMLMLSTTMKLQSGLAETVAPGKSLVCLVRPLHWDAGMAHLVTAGEYQLRLHYLGTAPSAQQGIKRDYPNNPLVSTWTGDVASTMIAFTLSDTPENRLPEPVWGPVNQGLQAAVRYRSASGTPQALRDTATATFPHGTRLKVEYEIKNVSAKTITFETETWRQSDTVVLTDAAGNETRLGSTWYSGRWLTECWTLKPGQVAVISAIDIGIADVGQLGAAFEDQIGSIVAVKPGTYQLRHELFNGWERGTKDKDGKPIPRKDWLGMLKTGNTPITVRARKAEDDPPTFTARLRFQAADGKPIEAGSVQVYRQSDQSELVKGEIKAGTLEVPRCPPDILMLDVRAPGFEETRLYDVAVEADRVTSLTLTRAEPVQLRLVTPAGQPVAGAKVRYFNRSTAEASDGSCPQDGLEGPVWATSSGDGQVILDTLQKIDPLNRKLGNNLYWFYVEPPAHAPFFIGPVQAGQDLGKMTVSPYLEVRGEVRGTPAELAAFAAEWDQPLLMKGGKPEANWTYAESKTLQTQRKGDKLTFQLSGLRPGTLRIVSRFKGGGRPISYEFARRTPNEDDVVYEVELTASRSDLVLVNLKAK
jgi:hypothetical protein